MEAGIGLAQRLVSVLETAFTLALAAWKKKSGGQEMAVRRKYVFR